MNHALYERTLFYRHHRSLCMRRATLSETCRRLSLRVSLRLSWRNRCEKIATRKYRRWAQPWDLGVVRPTGYGNDIAGDGGGVSWTRHYLVHSYGCWDYSALSLPCSPFQVIHFSVRHSRCIKPHINCRNKKALQPDLIWRVPCYCRCGLASPSTLVFRLLSFLRPFPSAFHRFSDSVVFFLPSRARRADMPRVICHVFRVRATPWISQPLVLSSFHPVRTSLTERNDIAF